MDKEKSLPKPDVPLSQIIKDREVTIEKKEESITWITEEIKYKEAQLKRGIVEENVSTLYNLVSYPLDHKKPRHVLKIEIGLLKKQIGIKKNSIKIMKELQVEDKKKEEKNAT